MWSLFNKKEKAAWVLYIIIAVAIFAHSLYLRLCNPTLTETQLLIEFWPWWLLHAVGILSGYGLLRWLVR